jgi:hypothetical protein
VNRWAINPIHNHLNLFFCISRQRIVTQQEKARSEIESTFQMIQAFVWERALIGSRLKANHTGCWKDAPEEDIKYGVKPFLRAFALS